MKLAIDTRIAYKNDKAISAFALEFWKDMAIAQPVHHFIFITNEKLLPQSLSNLQLAYLRKTHIQWIDRRRLRNKLLQLKADKLVTLQQTGFTVSNNLAEPAKKNTAQTGKKVFFSGSKPVQKEALQEQETFILQPALKEVITSLTWAESESIKTQYTGGRSFFLFTGDISEQHQLIELLKAFSVFKKWQQSNMQLVITGSYTAWCEVFEEKLQTYKYKDDVVILKKLNNIETAKLVAASYALLYPVTGNVFPLALLWAVQANKAIISTDNAANRQITDAAIWVEEKNTAEGFAKAMISLYKDENQQQLLVQQTIEQSKQFNRQQMHAEAWQCIEQ